MVVSYSDVIASFTVFLYSFAGLAGLRLSVLISGFNYKKSFLLKIGYVSLCLQFAHFSEQPKIVSNLIGYFFISV